MTHARQAMRYCARLAVEYLKRAAALADEPDPFPGDTYRTWGSQYLDNAKWFRDADHKLTALAKYPKGQP